MGKSIVIGLDFGTTYSGVAYCDDGRSADDISSVKVIIEWPGSKGTNEKVPSRISYGQPPEVKIKWGYLIKPNDKAQPHALMKLKLDEQFNKSKHFRMLLQLLTSGLGNMSLDDFDPDDDDEDESPEYPGKEPVEIIADYLSHVRAAAWDHMKKIYGENLFNSLEKRLIITVPAVWSERAKDRTLKAVQKSDWQASRISIVTEPEAAAIYTLKYMNQGAQSDQVKVGDCFVLCDAGGGTVDLISYKITRTIPTFAIEEAVVGSGDKCGATYVDKEFLNWLQSLIGEELYTRIPAEKLRHGSPMMNEFETHKNGFAGNEEDEEFQVLLPRECRIVDDESKRIEDGRVTITNAQMKRIFDPCVNRTLELIDGQVMDMMKNQKMRPKMILVVGGFGRNAYLFNRITQYAQERSIATQMPDTPWSAVVKGAVCRGLEGSNSGLVEVRLARKHYGTPVSMLFNPRVHDIKDRYIDEYDGRAMAKGQMRWLVDKGERLPEKTPKIASISCSASFHRDEERALGAVLVGCDEDVPAKRYADEKAYNVCRVKADLSDVPLSKFALNRSGPNGKEYYSADFKLQAKLVGGNIEWSFFMDGKSYGSVNVSYDT